MDCILLNILDVGENVDLKVLIIYKFEYFWNYEVGSYFILWEGKLWMDFVVFLMDMCD